MATLMPPAHEVVLPASVDHSPWETDVRRIESKWPQYSEDDIAAVVDVLRSGRVNALQHGDKCRAFEQAFADMCDMPFAISLANGTLALELALRALDVGAGDEVIVTPRSFIASAGCVVSAGATPVFADVDTESQNLTAASIEAAITSRTRAVILVHLAGWPCEMDDIMALARRRGLLVIEDCAQAHGATYRGRPVGSFGDAAAFSFCTDKIISTGGEGGMLLLRDQAVWAKAWSYKDHGKNHERVAMPAIGKGFRWLHDTIGTNWRMTEMQAAIGLRQLASLPQWIGERGRNAAILNDVLADQPLLRRTLPPSHIGHAYYKYYAFILPDRLKSGWTRDRIVEEIGAAGVPCFSGSCPEIYKEKAFIETGLAPEQPLPSASLLGKVSIMFPVDQTLDAGAVGTMAQRSRMVLMAATAR